MGLLGRRHKLGGLKEQCKLSKYASFSGVRDGAPENLDFLAFWDLKNYVRTVCQIMFFFDTTPTSQYVVNTGAENKLNSTSGYRIIYVVIM